MPLLIGFIILCVVIGAVVLIPEVRALFVAIAGLALTGLAVIAGFVFILYLLFARH